MKKKAFTLTELLVVVVIIGTLAAVVLPKFTKVLETRRTTEAEDIMRAVRSEQEARCTLDRNYTIRPEALSSWPENTGNNYAYALKRGGITATRQGETAYTLNMAYGDGSICCEGDACNDLNKYSQCSASYLNQVNNGNTQCAAPEAACNLHDQIESCGAGYTGSGKGCRVNADCTECVPFDNCEPITAGCEEGTEQNVQSTCYGTKGERCEGGEWVPFTNNDTTPKPGNTTQTCPTGDTVTCTYTCNDTTGAWDKTCEECPTCTEGEEQITSSKCGKKSGKRCVSNAWVSFTDEATDITAEEKASCACETQPPDETQECPEGTGTQTRSYECNSSTGKYEAGEWTGECTIEGECNLSYTELTSYTGEDTCDGNNEEQYAGVPPNHESCYDIYYNPGTQTTTAGCPRSCKRSCPSGQTCRCVPHPVAGNPAGYYTEECTGNNYFPGGQTGVGTGGTAVTFGRDYYRLVECQ